MAEGGERRRGSALTELVNRCAHFVQLFWADVWAVCEAEVDEAPFAEEVLLGEGRVFVCGQREGAADVWSTDFLVLELLLWRIMSIK